MGPELGEGRRWLFPGVLFLALMGQPDAAENLPATLQETLTDGGVAPALILISPGGFVMGSPADEAGRSEDEGPLTTVRIEEAFYLEQTEVTVAEFSHFVSVTGYELDSEVSGCYLWRDGRLDPQRNSGWKINLGSTVAPTTRRCVTRRDAFRYVEWLSAQTDAHYRLPSEAEGEYAARSGTEASVFGGETRCGLQACQRC